MKYIIYLVIAVAIIVGLFIISNLYTVDRQLGQLGQNVDETGVTVTNYNECVAAGYPVMESYPEQCSDGETTFVNQIEEQREEENMPEDTPEPDVATNIPDTSDTQTDNDVIIGMTVAQAQAYAAEAGVPFRIGLQDGEYLAVTMDYRPGRITASVTDGVVTKYSVE